MRVFYSWAIVLARLSVWGYAGTIVNETTLAEGVADKRGWVVLMGKAIVVDLSLGVKNSRSYYTEAYSALRAYYAGCQSGQFSDLTLMDWKLELWKKHGKYLDVVWQHHFCAQVYNFKDSIGAHGWVNSLRYYQFIERFNQLCELDYWRDR